MKALVGLILLSMSFNQLVSAQEFLEFGVDDYKTKASKWQFDVGVNYVQYPTYMPEFKGKFYSTRNVENYDIYGPAIGIGRDFHLGAGISISAKVGGFYYWTFDNEKGQASKDIDVELASNRRNHRLYGSNATMALNYVIEGKSLDIQPFITGSVGIGKAQVEREYKYLGLDDSEGTQEENREVYDIKLEDTFSYREAGIGLNFITKRGIVTYIKATRTTIALNDREMEGKIKKQGEIENPIKNNKGKNREHEVNSASIGMGFLF